jgi:2-dehydro-3-deoxyglucarate aldolase
MNRIREAIKEKGYALGGGTIMGDGNNIEMMARAGLDYIWVDMQHSSPSPWDSRAIVDMLRAAEDAGSTLLIRIPEANPALVCKVLDTGVRNIIVPEISGQEEIEVVTKGGRYHINGEGGRSLGKGREAVFSHVDLEHLKKVNSEVMLGVMLEKREAIDSLGNSLSLKSIDFAFIGPTDLSISLGLPLQVSNPMVQDYIRKAEDYCKKEGILLGYSVTKVEDARKKIKEGYKLITIGADLIVIFQHFKDMVERIMEGKGS